MDGDCNAYKEYSAGVVAIWPVLRQLMDVRVTESPEQTARIGLSDFGWSINEENKKLNTDKHFQLCQ